MNDNHLYYGKTKDRVKKRINLQEAYLDKESKSKTNFKIITIKTKIKIKAENLADKQKWLVALEKITGDNNKLLIMQRSKLMDEGAKRQKANTEKTSKKPLIKETFTIAEIAEILNQQKDKIQQMNEKAKEEKSNFMKEL